MRIGLNLLYLIPGLIGGTATYARGLLAGLSRVGGRHEFVVFVNKACAAWPLPEGRFHRVVCPVEPESRVARYAFEQLRLPPLLAFHEVNILHSLAYVSPLFAGRASVVTIPDLNFVNFRAFGAQMPLPRRLALQVFVREAARRADHVITISEFSRSEICRHIGIEAGRISVTPLAAGAEWREAGLRAKQDRRRRPYAVSFSNASPHKNMGRLVAAYGLARTNGLDLDLVLVGHPPPRSVIKPTDGVTFTGFLGPEELVRTVANASMLVFPSVYEGFGLPILEAMAAGVPVVCSNRASLPEVAGSAAVYFDPESTEDMAKIICDVAADGALRDRLRVAGLENEARFSWEATASQTLDVYARVVNARSIGDRRSTGRT